MRRQERKEDEKKDNGRDEKTNLKNVKIRGNPFQEREPNI